MGESADVGDPEPDEAGGIRSRWLPDEVSQDVRGHAAPQLIVKALVPKNSQAAVAARFRSAFAVLDAAPRRFEHVADLVGDRADVARSAGHGVVKHQGRAAGWGAVQRAVDVVAGDFQRLRGALHDRVEQRRPNGRIQGGHRSPVDAEFQHVGLVLVRQRECLEPAAAVPTTQRACVAPRSGCDCRLSEAAARADVEAVPAWAVAEGDELAAGTGAGDKRTARKPEFALGQFGTRGHDVRSASPGTEGWRHAWTALGPVGNESVDGYGVASWDPALRMPA